MYLIKSMLSHNSSIHKKSVNVGKLLLMVAAIAASSCTGGASTDADAPIDTSFLSGVPCAAPCWYGLEIDKSPKADVIAKLDQLPFVVHEKYQEYGTVWAQDENAKEIQFKCLSEGEVCGGAVISNDKLKQLWLRPSYELSIQKVVDQIGSPDFLDYGALNVEGGCRIVLWWELRGIAVDSIDEANYEECQNLANGNKLSSSRMVRLIIYFAKEGFGPSGECCPRISWPGFAES